MRHLVLLFALLFFMRDALIVKASESNDKQHRTGIRSESTCKELYELGTTDLSYCQFSSVLFDTDSALFLHGKNANNSHFTDLIIDIGDSNLSYSLFVNAKIQARNSDFSNSILDGTKFLGDFNIFIDNNFTNASCQACEFGSELKPWMVVSSNHPNNFNGANLSNSVFKGVVLTTLNEWKPGLILKNANLTNVDLSQMIPLIQPTADYWGFSIDISGSTINGMKMPSTAFYKDVSSFKACNITGDPVDPLNRLFRVQKALFGFAKMNYSGCDLRNYEVQNSIIDSANFSNARLQGTSFKNTTFRNTTFQNANVESTNFSTSRFFAPVRSSGLIGIPRLPVGYKLINGFIVGANMVLDGINLDNANLRSMNLSGSIMQNTTINNVNLSDARLNSASWTNVNVGTSNFTGADFTNALITGSFNQAQLSGIRSGDTCFGGVLPENYVAISQSQVSICNNEDAQVRGFIAGPNVDLSNRDISGVSLLGVNLTNADLRKTNLSFVNITEANLTGADLTNATLYGTYLDSANLQTAQLNGVSSGNIRGNPLLPAEYTVVNGYILGPNVDLYGASLINANLSNLDLSDSNITAAKLTGADLTNTDLSGALLIRVNATNAKFNNSILTRVNLARSTLNKANFSLSFMEETDLTGSSINESQFSGAKFIYVKTGNLSGIPTSLPSDYVLRNGYLIGIDADLTNATLTNINLNNVNLTRARLNGLQTNKITGKPILRKGYQVINGYVLGPYVNLVRANLNNQTLSNVDLSGADLRRSSMMNAKLINVTIRDTQFSGAIFSGIQSNNLIGVPATLPTGYTLRNGKFIKNTK